MLCSYPEKDKRAGEHERSFFLIILSNFLQFSPIFSDFLSPGFLYKREKKTWEKGIPGLFIKQQAKDFRNKTGMRGNERERTKRNTKKITKKY